MISGTTRLAGVIGDPVRHSLSPQIHNAAFQALDLDWVYVALPVAAGQGGEALEAMRILNIEGLSVTMPHKAEVASGCDRLTETARVLGVCNTVYRVDEGGDRLLVGHSSDGDGFVRGFEVDFDVSPAGLHFLVAGAGGSARAIVEALGRAGAAQITVTNRTVSSAQAMIDLAPGRVTVVESSSSADAVAKADVVVNATAVGMAGGPAPNASAIPLEAIRPDQMVVDIVYQPRVTPLLAAASARGARTANGLGMLAGQAAEQFYLWTGETAPFAVILNALSSQ